MENQNVSPPIVSEVQPSDTNLRNLHQSLSKEKGFTVPFEEFKTDMQDENNLKTLYSNLSKRDGFTVPYDEFKTDMLGGRLSESVPQPVAQPDKGFWANAGEDFVNASKLAGYHLAKATEFQAAKLGEAIGGMSDNKTWKDYWKSDTDQSKENIKSLDQWGNTIPKLHGGAGGFVASSLPMIGATAAAIMLKNPMAATALTGTMGQMMFGSGIDAYDKHIEQQKDLFSKGQIPKEPVVDEGTKLGTGILYGVLGTLPIAGTIGKWIPKGLFQKSIQTALDSNPETINNAGKVIWENFVKDAPGVAKQLLNQAKEGLGTSIGSMEIMQLGQKAVDKWMIGQEGIGIKDFGETAVSALGSAILFHGALVPFSMYAQNAATMQRREAQGRVNLGKDVDGNPVEVVNDGKGGFYGVTPDGKTVKVNPGEVQHTVTIPINVFKQSIQEAKGNGGKLFENADVYEVKGNLQNTADQVGYKNTGDIYVHFDQDGKRYFIKDGDLKDPKAKLTLVGEDGKTYSGTVPKNQINSLTKEQFISEGLDRYTSTKPTEVTDPILPHIEAKRTEHIDQVDNHIATFQHESGSLIQAKDKDGKVWYVTKGDLNEHGSMIFAKDPDNPDLRPEIFNTTQLELVDQVPSDQFRQSQIADFDAQSAEVVNKVNQNKATKKATEDHAASLSPGDAVTTPDGKPGKISRINGRDQVFVALDENEGKEINPTLFSPSELTKVVPPVEQSTIEPVTEANIPQNEPVTDTNPTQNVPAEESINVGTANKVEKARLITDPNGIKRIDAQFDEESTANKVANNVRAKGKVSTKYEVTVDRVEVDPNDEYSDVYYTVSLRPKEAAVPKAEKVSETASTKPTEAKQGQVPKAVKPKKEKSIPKIQTEAYNTETNPRDVRSIVLKYFIGGGKINKSALQELFGKKKSTDRDKAVESERRPRFTWVSDTEGSSINDIAHALWQEHGVDANGDNIDGMSDQDFRNEIGSVISDYTHPTQMARDLIKANDPNKQQYTEEEIAEMVEFDRLNAPLSEKDITFEETAPQDDAEFLTALNKEHELSDESQTELNNIYHESYQRSEDRVNQDSPEPKSKGTGQKATTEREGSAEITQAQDELKKAKSTYQKANNTYNRLKKSPEFGGKGQISQDGSVAGHDAIDFGNDAILNGAKKKVDQARLALTDAEMKVLKLESKLVEKVHNQQDLFKESSPLSDLIDQSKKKEEVIPPIGELPVADTSLKGESVSPEIPKSKDGLYQIYPAKVKNKDGGIDNYFVVPSVENKEKGGFGDGMYKTLAEAEKAVEENRKEEIVLAEEKIQKEKQKELDLLAEKEKQARKEANKGKSANEVMNEAKVDKTLDTLVRYDNGVMTRREHAERIIKEGGHTGTAQVNKIKDLSRTAYNRMDGYQQDAFEKRQKEAGKITEYRLYYKDGSFSDVTKAEYDYANSIEGKKNETVAPLEGLIAQAKPKEIKFNPDDKVIFTDRQGKQHEVNFRGYMGKDKAVIADKSFGQMTVDTNQLTEKPSTEVKHSELFNDVMANIEFNDHPYSDIAELIYKTDDYAGLKELVDVPYIKRDERLSKEVQARMRYLERKGLDKPKTLNASVFEPGTKVNTKFLGQPFRGTVLESPRISQGTLRVKNSDGVVYPVKVSDTTLYEARYGKGSIVDSIKDLLGIETESKKNIRIFEEAKSIAKAVNDRSNIHDNIQWLPGNHVIEDLRRNGIRLTNPEGLIKGDWRGLTVGLHIYLNPRLALSPELIVRTTIHEKAHAYFNDILGDDGKIPVFNELYDEIGNDEIWKTVPEWYKKGKNYEIAEEYITHKIEDLVERIENQPNKSAEEILNEILAETPSKTAQETIVKTINEIYSPKNIKNDLNTFNNARRSDNKQQYISGRKGLFLQPGQQEPAMGRENARNVRQSGEGMATESSLNPETTDYSGVKNLQDVINTDISANTNNQREQSAEGTKGDSGKIGGSSPLLDSGAKKSVRQSREGVGSEGSPNSKQETKSSVTHALDVLNGMYSRGEKPKTVEEKRKAQLAEVTEKKWVESAGEKLRRGMQDAELSGKLMQEFMEKATGEKLPDHMNPYVEQNLESSKNAYAIKQLEETIVKPLVRAKIKLKTKYEVTDDQIGDYVMATHAPERNMTERQKRVDKDYAKIENSLSTTEQVVNLMDDLKAKNWHKDQITNMSANEFKVWFLEKEKARLEKKYSQNDYAGLTQWMLEEVKDGTYKPSNINEDPAKWSVDEFARFKRKQFEDKVTDKNDLKELWDQIKKLTKFSLDQDLKSGRINQKNYDFMLSRWEHYVPLRGFENITAGDLFDYNGADTNGMIQPMKRIKGRTSKADDPFANMVSMAQSSIIQGNKNRTAINALYMVREFPQFQIKNGGDGFYKLNKTVWVKEQQEIDGETEDVWVEHNENERVIPAEDFESGKAKRTLDNSDFPLRRFPYQAQESEITAYEDGVSKVIHFADPDVARAYRGINKESTEKVVKAYTAVIGVPTRIITRLWTTYSPKFILSNTPVDLMFSELNHLVNSNGNFIGFNQALPGSAKVLSKYVWGGRESLSPVYDSNGVPKNLDAFMVEFLELGAETGFSHQMSIAQHRIAIKKLEKELAGGVIQTPKKVLNVMIDQIQHTAELSEGLSRLATYIASRKAGKSAKASAFDAHEITVNFTKSGKYTAIFSPLYGFFNVGFQSLRTGATLINQNKGKGTAALAALVALGYATAAVLSATSPEDDKDKSLYYSLSDYDRFNKFIIRNGKGFIVITAPHFFRAFYALGVGMHDIVSGHKDMKDGIMDISGNMLSTLSPINMQGSGFTKDGVSARFVIPTAVQPWTDLSANQDAFGSRIYKEPFLPAMEGVDPAYVMSMPYVNPTLKEASRRWNNLWGGDDNRSAEIVFNDKTQQWEHNYFKGAMGSWNPSKIEHVAEYMGGGAARSFNELAKTVDYLIEKGKGKDVQLEPRSTPGLSTFYREPKSVNDISKDYNKLKSEMQLQDFMTAKAKEEMITNKNSSPFIKEMTNIYTRRRMAAFDIAEKQLEQLNKSFKFDPSMKNAEMMDRVNQIKKTAVSEVEKINKNLDELYKTGSNSDTRAKDSADDLLKYLHK